MSRKLKMKLAIDFLMTLALLLLMPYELIGESVHEWIGAGMFVLFVLHHILNRKWTGNLGKGRCTPFRIVQTFLVVLILISFLGSMVSGVILSRHLFAFLRIRGISALASRMHMVCAYWGFALMSLHLGIHWGMMVKTAQKHLKKASAARTWIVRAAAFILAVYGLYAFWKRDIGSYMLMRVHFVFFDYEEPVFFFLLDYMAAMGLFVFIGYYVSEGLKKAGNRSGRKKRKKEQ